MHDFQSISDWLALCEAKARYCRTLDTKDWQGFADLMMGDLELDMSATSDLGVIRGRDAAISMIRSSIELARTVHQVHSPEMSIDGDEAQVIWAMQDRVVWGEGRPSLTGYGHYHERWLRHNGKWKLAALRLTRLHMDML